MWVPYTGFIHATLKSCNFIVSCKKRKSLAGFENGTSRLQDQCIDHLPTKANLIRWLYYDVIKHDCMIKCIAQLHSIQYYTVITNGFMVITNLSVVISVYTIALLYQNYGYNEFYAWN